MVGNVIRLEQQNKFPTYLLNISNNMIKEMLNRAIEKNHGTSGQVKLAAVVQLQIYEIILQNMLVNRKGDITSEILKAMQYKLVDLQSFSGTRNRCPSLQSGRKGLLDAVCAA